MTVQFGDMCTYVVDIPVQLVIRGSSINGSCHAIVRLLQFQPPALKWHPVGGTVTGPPCKNASLKRQ